MTLPVEDLITALLFGGMTLYSFGFAAFLFTTLPAETAGLALRRAFPFFYLFVIVSALPAINRATDRGQAHASPHAPTRATMSQAA